MDTTSYETMVQRLFKQLPHLPHGSLMHAASALLGEAVEWTTSNNRKNFIEEAGDIEFYIEALLQSVGYDRTKAQMFNVDIRSSNTTLANVFHNVATLSNDIFDIAKKAFVYGKDYDLVALISLVVSLQRNMQFAYELFGTNAITVQYQNKMKLIGPGGRYESGFYSDAQAIARKDKLTGDELDPLQAPVERSFIGKAKPE